MVVLELLNRIADTREQKKVRHPLPTILFISLCAIFCGAESWEDIKLWGEVGSCFKIPCLKSTPK